MKYIQNLWRSIACLLISAVGIGLLFLGACKITPFLFQDSMWAKIGILAVGIEIGAFVLYLAMMLLSGAIMGIAQNRKTPVILSLIPILYAIIRYPWWLISSCISLPFSIGFWQWVIIISWIGVWVVTLAISMGALYNTMSENQENQQK